MLGKTQIQLRFATGTGESTAPLRIGQYERGKDVPDSRTTKPLTNVLSMPFAYLFCDDDELAALIAGYTQLTWRARRQRVAPFGKEVD